MSLNNCMYSFSYALGNEFVTRCLAFHLGRFYSKAWTINENNYHNYMTPAAS